MSDESRIMHHEYDGIREYDNPLPFWWSAVFVVTIVFAAGYWFWYHAGGPGKTEPERFAGEWRDHQAIVAEANRKAGLVVTEELLANWAKDPAQVEAGRKIFITNCVGCHLEDGRGQTGPNLTDPYQIHGATRMDMFRTVQTGVLAKGMPAWGEVLPPRSVALAAAFAITLRDKPVAGKAPEGARVERFPEITP